MTLSINLLTILSFLLVLNYLTTAQDVDTTTVAEANTESSSPLPSTEKEKIYTTCDFDLENIESLLQYLPDICTEIYNNNLNGINSDLYNLYLEESQNFAKFYKKLSDYELRDVPPGEELSKYPFESELRNETYTTVDLSECVTIGNSSATDYLKCFKDKRLQLADLIPSVPNKESL